MKPGQESAVVQIVRNLSIDFGSRFTSKISEQVLRDNADMLRIEVAEETGKIIGFCSWVMTFSTWRGAKGMYISDHYMEPDHWSEKTAKELLQLAVKNASAEGACFARLEVDLSEEQSGDFYSDIGFWYEARLMLHYLETGPMTRFVSAKI